MDHRDTDQHVAPAPGLLAQLREDREVNGGLSRPGFQAIALHRFTNWSRRSAPRWSRGLCRVASRTGFVLVRNVYGIELPASVVLGRRVRIAHQHGIVIHPGTVIGDGCTIRQGVSLGAAAGDAGRFHDQAPSLGEDVSLGVGAVVVGGVHLGDGAMIGPNATVLTSVPAGARVLAQPPRTVSFPPAVARREAELRER